MARRTAYTKVERKDFHNPDHVDGMGDKTFRGFQCLNKECQNFIFIQTATIPADFEYECQECHFVHRAGDATKVYDYDLTNVENSEIIESGPFEILHDDYISEAKEFKYCIICGSLKPFEAFGLHKKRQTGRQGECKICKQIYNGIKNQTRLVEQHREASQKRRLYTHFEEPTRLDIAAIYRRFENRCFKCGTDLSDDLTAGVEKKEGNLDHTLPVFFLWPLTTDNATLLCREHNGAKAEKWPSDFYNDAQLRRLSALTGIEYKLLSGAPEYNPSAIEKLNDPSFIELLFQKFARHPEELLRLRNRIMKQCNFDFLSIGANISDDWRKRADEMIAK